MGSSPPPRSVITEETREDSNRKVVTSEVELSNYTTVLETLQIGLIVLVSGGRVTTDMGCWLCRIGMAGTSVKSNSARYWATRVKIVSSAIRSSAPVMTPVQSPLVGQVSNPQQMAYDRPVVPNSQMFSDQAVWS
jgi:hypothetical protein